MHERTISKFSRSIAKSAKNKFLMFSYCFFYTTLDYFPDKGEFYYSFMHDVKLFSRACYPSGTKN